MATIEEGRARQRAMRTYCPGFEMRMTRDVTFGDIRRMCASLNATYAEGHEFEPEAISEGGIQWSAKDVQDDAATHPESQVPDAT